MIPVGIASDHGGFALKAQMAAIASPIPLLPPVTTATLPSSFAIFFSLVFDSP